MISKGSPRRSCCQPGVLDSNVSLFTVVVTMSPAEGIRKGLGVEVVRMDAVVLESAAIRTRVVAILMTTGADLPDSALRAAERDSVIVVKASVIVEKASGIAA
mmetsp:Transcript_10534/g.9561  ORF Transcript_10534/g.9561 Transcript_10534/m.9561 type:complete len:103 (-) Transcript_10534:77-385(-)